jgi:hypothetical protein
MTTNGDSPDQPPLDEVLRQHIEDDKEAAATAARAALDVAALRTDLGRHLDRLEGKLDALVTDTRRTRTEQIAQGKILSHMFEGLGSIATSLEQQRDRIGHLEGGLAIVKDHTAAQWRIANEHRRALHTTDPRGLKDLDEDTKIRNLPSLSDIDLTVERKIDQRELDKHRKRWERLAGAWIAICVALISAIVTWFLKR